MEGAVRVETVGASMSVAANSGVGVVEGVLREEKCAHRRRWR
jgi:hypothetical protein